MSIYNFAPKASHHQSNPFVTWNNAFSDEEIEKIITLCESLPNEKATIGGIEDTNISAIRESRVSWLTLTQESEWVYDRLAQVARALNAEFYNFDLSGFIEHMQFTVYNGEVDGHYTWHIDSSSSSVSPRKLSIVLQLSDPSEYEGGVLQTMTGVEPVDVDRKKGLIAAFPSWALHRVTPVTKGVRKTLVVWVGGPQFR